MTRRTLRRLLAALVATTVLLAGTGAAHAAPTSSTHGDRKGDASATLDIRKVKVVSRAQYVEVQVTLTKLGTTPGSKSQSNAWVHFDTKGSAAPDFAMGTAGFHWYSGSVSGWYNLRANKYGDPYGDWTSCGSKMKAQWTSYSKSKKRITFRAPKDCLKNPKRVRVEVSTVKESGTRKTDWLGTKKKYTTWVAG